MFLIRSVVMVCSCRVFLVRISTNSGLGFFFSSRRRHTRYWRDWSSDVCSSDLASPGNLAKLEGIIRERVRRILDGLPRGETFNWVEHVSIELTVQMLATLFDFPQEDRRKLSFWSDCATMPIEAGGYITSEEKREEVFTECLAYFTELWNQRVNAEPQPDLISMLAHGEATRNMTSREFLGNLILLIVGGNDTTRDRKSTRLNSSHANI